MASGHVPSYDTEVLNFVNVDDNGDDRPGYSSGMLSTTRDGRIALSLGIALT